MKQSMEYRGYRITARVNRPNDDGWKAAYFIEPLQSVSPVLNSLAGPVETDRAFSTPEDALETCLKRACRDVDAVLGPVKKASA